MIDKYWQSVKSTSKSKIITAVILGLVSFVTYSCMYAIRKPFSGFIYTESLWGWNIKNWMVIAQLIGYTLSKFYGIRWVGQLKPQNRRRQLIFLLILASVPLWVMPLLPIFSWPILMLLNGFPLGIVWGIVFSYIEGRDLTEFIGAILACTFVFSSGFVKYLTLLIQQDLSVSNTIATALTSALACFLAIIFSFFLNKTPPPNLSEINQNTKRKELSKIQQKLFFKENLIFLIPTILIYSILTFSRDFRDNFTAELLAANNDYSGLNIAKYETLITLVLLSCIPFLSLIRNHLKAIQITFIVSAFGSILNLVALQLFEFEIITSTAFFLVTGFGLYGGYILINISIMNRIVGYRKSPGNCGFLMYSADASGYLTSIMVMSIALFQNKINIDWFGTFKIFIGIGSILITIISFFPLYYSLKLKNINE